MRGSFQWLQQLLEDAETVGSCGNYWMLRRVAGEAHNMTENAFSILIIIFFVRLQQTKISNRKLFIFQHGPHVRRSDDTVAVTSLLLHCECEIF